MTDDDREEGEDNAHRLMHCLGDEGIGFYDTRREMVVERERFERLVAQIESLNMTYDEQGFVVSGALPWRRDALIIQPGDLDPLPPAPEGGE
jgi:hypothetical protein